MTDQLEVTRHRIPPSHEASNGLGRSALWFAVIGAVTGALAFLFPIAAVCGAIGLVLGVRATLRCRRGEATNARTAGVAVVVSVLALLLALVGYFVGVVASEDITPPSETAAVLVR